MKTSENVTALEEKDSEEKQENKLTKWVKRLGVAGFLFFLIKGILWLVAGAAVLRFFGCEG